MSKNKKVPISEFISDKKLDKILSIIKKSDDVETNYDRIEMLLDDDYEVKDLGTNRIVFLHKKKKYKNLIIKVAGDDHGIEANYREFYNGDLDKRLTFSYSISSNGVFLVQERVTRMTRDMMKERKRDVRHMLGKLSKKLLLVDCKLSNFKNFGVRKNGDVCLLDHGDTVPLPEYQDNEIVNINEESFVSLRCKKPEEMSANIKKLKPCGGKLKYSKNFDCLICEKCGGICTVNDAYREFYGDKNIKIKGGAGLNLDDNFDADEWKSHIKQYCIETMSHTNNKNKENKGENEMKNKIIDGRNCIQVKGFWLPEPSNETMQMLYVSVRMGDIDPKKYIEKLGLNINDYKVYPTDHSPIGHNSSEDAYRTEMNDTANKIICYAISKGNYETFITYLECAAIAPKTDFANKKKVHHLRSIINSDKRTAGCVYNDEGISVRILPRFSVKEFNENTERKYDFIDTSSDSIESIDKSAFDVDNNVTNKIDSESDNFLIKSYTSENVSNVINSVDDIYDMETEAEEYSKEHDSINVEEDYSDETNVTKKTLILTDSDIENSKIVYNGKDCVIINKYAIPLSIIYNYENDKGEYELPTTKMKALLKLNNIHPKKYKVTTNTSDSDESVEVNDATDSVEADDVTNSFKVDTTIVEPNYIESHDPENNIDDLNDFRNTFYETVKEYFNNHAESIDTRGYINVPMEDIIFKCFMNKFSYEKMDKYVTFLDDNNNFTLTKQNLDDLYDFIINLLPEEIETMLDYRDKTIGVEKEYILPLTDDEKYEKFIKETRSNEDDYIDVLLPLNLIDPERFFTGYSDVDSEYHEKLMLIITFIHTGLSLFYNLSDDSDLDHHEFFNIKEEVINRCDTLDEFHQYFIKNPYHLMTAIEFTELVLDTMSISVDDCNINDIKSYLNEIIDILHPSITTTTNSEPEESVENAEDVYKHINSDIGDNNTNNEENNIPNESEDDDSEMNKEILEAIQNLTKVIEENNRKLNDGNENIKVLYHNSTTAYDSLSEMVGKVLKSVEHISFPHYENTSESDCETEEKSVLPYSVNSDSSIISISLSDIIGKTIAINSQGKTICLDFSELIPSLINSTEIDEYFSVTELKGTKL